MIKKYKLDTPFIISTLEEHNSIKDTLLNLIELQPSIKEDGNRAGFQSYDKIAKTDYYVDKSFLRNYWNLLFPYLDKHMAPVFAMLDLKTCIYSDFWFQQYAHLDTHAWHRHNRCFYSNVYYLELPGDGSKTIFKNPFNSEEIIYPDVKEGDILTFPSMVEHCSPPNTSTDRKTIISFNID